MLSELDEESDGSDDQDPLDGFLSEDDDESSILSSEPLSPSAQAAHDARQRMKDEQRLQLDLSKHQELLVDSQRMNQSLKRCLGWTEELIKEGRKALSYQVRVSDIAMGGRVLGTDEVELDVGQRQGLLSPSHEAADLKWDAVREGEGAETLGGVAEEGKEFREYLESLGEGQA